MYGDTTMIRRFLRWSPTLAAVAAGLLFLSAPEGARATLILTATQLDLASGFGGNPAVKTIAFADNNALGAPGTFTTIEGVTVFLGADSDPTLGDLLLAPGTVSGSFTVTGSFHQSQPLTGGPNDAHLISGASTVLNTSGAAHLQTIVISDVFTSPTGNVNRRDVVSGVFTQVGGSFAGSSITVHQYVDSGSSTHFGATGIDYNPVTNFVPTSGTPGYGSLNANFSSIVGLTAPFTERIVFDLTLANGVQLNSRSNEIQVSVPAVPEPASFALVLTGLPVLGLAALRRGRRKLS